MSEPELMEQRPSTSSVIDLSEPELMEQRSSTSGVNSSAASFEDLLLNRIGKTSRPNIKRKCINPAAKVIISSAFADAVEKIE